MPQKAEITIQRAYDKPDRRDGFIVLVDRIWPRGIKKEALHHDLWLKDVAPSSGLRQWFNHDPKKFSEFSKRYREELESNPATNVLKKITREYKKIILLYSAKDEKHNQAVVLKNFLDASENQPIK